jgi:RimJ/RimL family protein N-acetyltransferase
MDGLRLEPFGEEHLPGVEAMLDDPDLLRFTRIAEPVRPGFAHDWLERYRAGRRDGTAEAFAIAGPGGEFLGLAMAPVIEAGARQAELGYVVAPHARGRGVATRALALLTEWAFREARLQRLSLLISVDNEASKKVAQRNGYVLEGVLRSLYFKQGRREDTELWSRLPGDAPVSAAAAS